mmetsp:Transcript_31375/g.54449  ORF Transcript_31375/g.54449 Transcript_31375/m.54449 type:complete len:171 (+) Transcript_31375:442-954(+)
MPPATFYLPNRFACGSSSIAGIWIHVSRLRLQSLAPNTVDLQTNGRPMVSSTPYQTNCTGTKCEAQTNGPAAQHASPRVSPVVHHSRHRATVLRSAAIPAVPVDPRHAVTNLPTPVVRLQPLPRQKPEATSAGLRVVCWDYDICESSLNVSLRYIKTARLLQDSLEGRRT